MSSFGAVLSGVPSTLELSVGALAVGAVGGIPLVLGRRSRHLAVRSLCRAIIEVVRGIPPLVWLFLIFFGVGASFPQLNPLTAAIIGLGVISSAYLAEIYRSGLSAIHVGQWEAADALGLRSSSTLRAVIAPQVVRVAIPAAATYAVGLLKDTSVAYAIGVPEIMFHANERSTNTSSTIEPFLVAAAVYIALTIPVAWASRRLDSRLRRRVAR